MGKAAEPRRLRRRRAIRGLPVPKDITVNRQVLAEPDAKLATKSWASLVDGTPLVTGEQRGKGVVALFHVSADMRWSDLPMSGTFVEMLRRIVDMSGYTSTPGAGVAGEVKAETVAPMRTLDGFGAFGPPPSTAKPLPADYRDRPRSNIRRASTARPTARSRSTRSPRPTASRRWIRPPEAQRASYHQPSRATCAACCCRRRSALFLIDAIIVALLGGGIAALLRRRAAARRAGRRAALSRAGEPRRQLPRARPRQRRVRDQGRGADAARLCRHRQCRRRFHRQGRPLRPDAVSCAAHRAGSRRTGRRRSGARRTGVLSADLLAGGARRGEAAATPSTASTPI